MSNSCSKHFLFCTLELGTVAITAFVDLQNCSEVEWILSYLMLDRVMAVLFLDPSAGKGWIQFFDSGSTAQQDLPAGRATKLCVFVALIGLWSMPIHYLEFNLAGLKYAAKKLPPKTLYRVDNIWHSSSGPSANIAWHCFASVFIEPVFWSNVAIWSYFCLVYVILIYMLHLSEETFERRVNLQDVYVCETLLLLLFCILVLHDTLFPAQQRLESYGHKCSLAKFLSLSGPEPC